MRQEWLGKGRWGAAWPLHRYKLHQRQIARAWRLFHSRKERSKGKILVRLEIPIKISSQVPVVFGSFTSPPWSQHLRMSYSLRSRHYFLEVWMSASDKFQVQWGGQVQHLPCFLLDPARADCHLPAQSRLQLKRLVLFLSRKTKKEVLLGFTAAASLVPRDGKVAEDAHFLTENMLGVADGVGGWKRLGIDSGVFAGDLVRACERQSLSALCSSDCLSDEEETASPRSCLLPLAENALRTVTSCGSATLLLCALRGSELEVLNIGDCKALLVRFTNDDKKVVMRTRPMQHNFNTPFQVSKLPGAKQRQELLQACPPDQRKTLQQALSSSRLINDGFSRAQIYISPAKVNDLLVVGSDGLWDNLYESEVLELLKDSASCESLSHTITRAAFLRSRSTQKTPFQDEAVASFGLQAWRGGKQDDITVVVARVKAVDSVRLSHSSPSFHQKRAIALTLETQSTDDQTHRTSPRPILQHLRNRTVSQTDIVTPELAAKVVADYILPMFESDTRSKTNADRKSTFNLLKNPARGTTPGTVYHELKLSEQISQQLESARSLLKTQTTRLKEVEQARESTQAELTKLQDDYMQLQASYQLVRTHLAQAIKQNQNDVLALGLAQDQLSMYKRLQESTEAENKALMSTLHEEKALSDKLKNRATELEQGSSLLKMENDIMGERLKGLYNAVDELTGKQGAGSRLHGEVGRMATAMRELAEFSERTVQELREVQEDRDHFRLEFMEMSKLRQDLKSEKERMLFVMREKVTSLMGELATARDELEKSRTSESKLEKRYKDLEEEHTRLRQKMKQSRLKRKQYGESDYKVCRWCQKEYLESENFNWSCRTHKGEFGDHMYWCCGKTSKDAIGCQVKKHESKEDEDDMQEKDREELEQLRLASTHCTVIIPQSCKEIGHRASECPKDPNLRSQFDTGTELKRIADMKERKKLTTMGLDVHQQMMAMFGEQWEAAFESSSSLSSELSESGEPSIDGPFKDIQKLKARVEFSPARNLVQQPPEELKESLRRSRTREPTQMSRREEMAQSVALQREIARRNKAVDGDLPSDSSADSHQPT